MTLNVTKDTIWARDTVMPEAIFLPRPTAATLAKIFGGQIPENISFPDPKSLCDKGFMRPYRIIPPMGPNRR